MTAPTVLGLLAVAMFVAAWLVYLLPVGECNECPHCKRLKEQEQASARERAHDVLHKGFGNRGPDILHCDNPLCPRNEELDRRRKK